MAVMTRRIWSAIEAETIRRFAGNNSTGFSLRADYWLLQSYLTLCLTYHHFELDREDLTLSTTITSNALTLPADCYAVLGMTLRDGTGAQVGEVSQYEFGALRQAYTAESGRPTRRARFGGKLLFDKKADAAYGVDLYYYRRPILPDFASVSAMPETDVDCDEAIILGACAIGNTALGRPDLAAIDQQALAAWQSTQIRPALLDPLEARERASTGRTLGGAQG